MKRTKASNGRPTTPDEMPPEYDLDYRKSRPNRFAGRIGGQRLVITLDPDVSEVFTTAESVNTILRALIGTMPPVKKARARR
jgi:hypothetical protein